MLRILNVYEIASGQTINLDKSHIWFSSNTSIGDKDMVRGVLGIRGVFEHENYLGLPLSIRKSRCRELKCLIDRIRSKVTRWNVKYLSQTGKETLIKSVAQSITIYMMSRFLLPSTIVDQFNTLVAHFWWGDIGSKWNIHWKN